LIAFYILHKILKYHLPHLKISKICPTFAKIIITMENTKKSTGLYWALFFASLVASVLVYKVGGGYCSMVLPFNVTFFAKAMDLM
jgi:hypothetical protein